MSGVRSGLAAASLLLLSCGGAEGGVGRWRGPPLGKAGAEAPGIVTVGKVPDSIASRTDEIWRLTVRARRLRPSEPVKLAVLSPSEMVGVVQKHVSTEVPPEAIRGEGRCYAALGLIPRDYDYEAETYALLKDELAGLYIPEDKTMYVTAGIEAEELDVTLSHELVHALQDQHFQIGKRMKYVPGSSDALAAIQALAEGDATSAMIDVSILAEGGEELLARRSAVDGQDKEAEDLVHNGAGKKGGKLGKTPRFLAVGLVAPYADGMRFVNALRRRGGWAAVDAAWAKPPASSEQLLHLQKYDVGEPPVVVAPATAAALGTGWKRTYDDVMGEAEGRLAIAEWMDLDTSKRAAAGWGGDHVALFEADGDKRAVAWRIVFDDEKEAAEAFDALASGWNLAFGIPQTSAPAGGFGELRVYGAPPAPAPAPPPGAKPVTLPVGKPALPPLPDAPGAPAGKPAIATGCRALQKAGREVDVLAGAPCAVLAAWAKEVPLSKTP